MMKNFSLGIDTSCYTTSLAIVDNSGKIVLDERIPLYVKQGQRGLRQSEAFYQHVLNLPELFEKASIYSDSITSLSASGKPRNLPESYMPVFTAGTAFAKTVSSMLSLPLNLFSHQDGHIYSVLPESGIDEKFPFYAVHLSGGTAEIMRVYIQNGRISTEIVGGSLDITAGQLLDRLGVRLGHSFPSGKALDEIAYEGKSDSSYRISVKGGYFNLSGVENMYEKDISSGMDASEIIHKTFKCISETLSKSFDNLKITGEPVLMTGGVSASRFLKNALSDKCGSIHFGPACLCTDNAVGIARMGIKLSGAD